MNEFLGKKVEEDLFVVNFKGEQLFLHVKSNKVWIDASDGIIINSYLKSGEYSIFIKYLSEREIKMLSL